MLTDADKEFIRQAIEDSKNTPQSKEQERKEIMQIKDRAERRQKIAEFIEKNGAWR